MVLPAFFLLLFYFLITSFLHQGYYLYITLILVMIVVLFQVFLILITGQSLTYLFWLVIYIIAYPIWNLVLPLYAFWHFDNFSWGRTRRIESYTDDFDNGNEDPWNIRCSGGNRPESVCSTKRLLAARRQKYSLVKKYWYEWEKQRRYSDRMAMETKIRKIKEQMYSSYNNKYIFLYI